jgi:hypothetical protein
MVGMRWGNNTSKRCVHLFFIFLFFFLLVDVVVFENISLLVSGNDTEPVTELMLLEETFGKVLKISLGEVDGSSDSELIVATSNLDDVIKVIGTAFDLDMVMEVLFISGNVKDLVIGRGGAVNDELVSFRLLGSRTRFLRGSHLRGCEE